jgi:hypothetical protein
VLKLQALESLECLKKTVNKSMGEKYGSSLIDKLDVMLTFIHIITNI